MTLPVYEPIEELPITDVKAALASDDPLQIIRGLLSASNYADDWQWAQQISLDFLRNENDDVKSVCLTCLSDIARIHGILDREKVMPSLQALAETDSPLAKEASEAIDEIEWYLANPPELDDE